MKEAIFYIIGGRSAEALEEEEDEYFETHVDSISKRRLAIELIIGTTIRNRNKKIAVFFNVVLSLLALNARVNREFWALFSAMRVLWSYRYTVDLARELGTIVEERNYEGQIQSMGILVADNKAYSQHTNFIRTDADGVNVQMGRLSIR